MTTVKLTKKFIDKVKPTYQDQITWDTEIIGFGLKVTPSGRKTFLLKYAIDGGQQRKPKIGTYGDITLEQARTMAKRWKAEIVQGGDPSADRQAKRADFTLNQFSESYFDNATNKKESTLATERCNYRNHIEKTLGKRQLTQIDQRDILEWYSGLAHVQGAANRTFSNLRAMFNEAERLQLRPPNSNPTKLIKKYQDIKRTRYLSSSELKRFGAALQWFGNNRGMHPSAIPAIKLLLLTGARKNEVLTLKWAWVDWGNDVIRLPDSKTGPRDIILSSDSKQVLSEIPKIKGNKHVLPGKKTGSHITNIGKAFSKILKNADIDDFHIHDLRHTNATYALKAGVPLQIISKTLGHSSTRSTERYAHVTIEPTLSAVKKTSDVLIGGLGGMA